MGKKDNKKSAKPSKGKEVKKPAKPSKAAKPAKQGKPAPKQMVKAKPAPKKGKPAPKPVAKSAPKGKPIHGKKIEFKKPMKGKVAAPVKGKAPIKPLKKGKDLTSKIKQKIELSVSKKKESDKKKFEFDKKNKNKKQEKQEKPLSKKELKLIEKQKQAALKEQEKNKKGKKTERGDDRDVVGELMKKKGLVGAVKEEITEEVVGLAEEFAVKEIFAAIKSLEFFKSDADDCLEKGCDNPATTMGYCRYHYIKDWKDIQKKKVILSEGKLHDLIEELVKKYPIRFIQAILDDLSDEKSFHTVLTELNIESDEFEDADDEIDDDEVDIAFETKTIGKASFEEDP